MMPLTLALSPCPNDTFLLYGWIKGKVGVDVPIEPVFADVEQLNEWALEGRHPLTKISIGVLPALYQRYGLLATGAALGYRCGPLLIAKIPVEREALHSKRVGFPGIHTSAHLLFDRTIPFDGEKRFGRYDQMMDWIESEAVDAAVIIHESRFLFEEKGCFCLADLGALWEGQTALPIPLGGFVLDHSLREMAPIIQRCMRESLAYSRAHLEEALAFCRGYSIEKDPAIIKSHIDLFVNAETDLLSDQGRQAIHALVGVQTEIFAGL